MKSPFLSIIVLVVVGCVAKPEFPRNPDAAGLTPGGFGAFEKMSESTHLAIFKNAHNLFVSFFGGRLPDSFRSNHATGWFAADARMKHIRVEAKVSRGDFKSRMEALRWREMPLPKEELAAMHLPVDVPRDYMTCFLGKLDGRRAAAYWSDYGETLMLVVDL